MFKKQYKEDFDSIIPDPAFIDHLAEKLNKNSIKKHPKLREKLLASVAAVCILIGGVAIAQYYNSPTFVMVAYADENNGKKMIINENARVVLPFGKISRGKEVSYVDKTGEKVYGYESGFENGGISVEGKNISSVTYACEKGEFRYYDSVMAKQMEKDGKIKVCEFTVPVDVFPSKDREATFEKLWNRGFFDSIKAKYFRDKSADLSDYRVQFSQMGEQIENGIWTITVYYKFEHGYPFEQSGKEVTATFYEEHGMKSLDVCWCPCYALDIVTEHKPINFADLPSDTITVTVRFTNGKTASKQANLSFDSYGNLIAELTEK